MAAGRVRGGVSALVLAALVPASGAVTAQPGVPTSITLPAPAAVGQSARTEAVIQTTIDGGPVSLRLVTSAAVTAVAANGSYTARSTIESVEVTNAPASADVNSWGFGELEGETFSRIYAASGRPLTAVTRAVNRRSLVLDSVSTAYVGFPAEPIDVGDSWTVDGQISSNGMSFDVTYQCRLASVGDGAYSVDVSYAEGFRSPVEGGVAEGTISGTGTLHGSVGNPLLLWGGLNQTIDGVVTTDNTATTMRQDTSVTLTATEG